MNNTNINIEDISGNKNFKIYKKDSYLVACKLCRMVLDDPVKCGGCVYHVCKNCAQYCCNSDGNSLISQEPDPKVVEELNKLRFNCRYSARGCNFTFTRNELAKHDFDCQNSTKCNQCSCSELDRLDIYGMDQHAGLECFQMQIDALTRYTMKAIKLVAYTLKDQTPATERLQAEASAIYVSKNSEALPTLCKLAIKKYDEKSKNTQEFDAKKLQVIDVDLKTKDDHKIDVWVLNKLPNEQLASGFDKYINIFDTVTGYCLRTIEGHTKRVFCLASLPKGILASGSFDCDIKIWNVNSGECVQTLEGHTKVVRALTSLPNGKLASGSFDCDVKIWNTYNGICVKTMKGHSKQVLSLAALPNGRLASGSVDNSVKIWNTESGECLFTLIGHEKEIWVLTSLHNDKVASGSLDFTVKIWNIDTGILFKTLRHESVVWALTSLPKGLLAVGSSEKSVRIWNTDNGECVFKYDIESDVMSLNYRNPDESIILGLANGKIKCLCKRSAVSDQESMENDEYDEAFHPTPTEDPEMNDFHSLMKNIVKDINPGIKRGFLNN